MILGSQTEIDRKVYFQPGSYLIEEKLSFLKLLKPPKDNNKFKKLKKKNKMK